MMKKPLAKLMALMALIAVAACSTDDRTADNAAAGRIAFATSVDMAETRAMLLTTATMTSYGVSCSVYPSANTYTSAAYGSYFYNQQVTDGSTNYYWPTASYRVSFFAYAPYGDANITVSPATTTGRPAYTYTVPSDISGQADFVTAEVLDHAAGAQSAPVTLNFSHACASIQFSVENKTTTDMTVHSIAVNGVKYQGTYANGSWTLSGNANSSSDHPFLLQPSSATTVAAGAKTDLAATDNYIIALPQTVASGTDFITLDATVSGSRHQLTYTLPADMTLEKGKNYKLNIVVHSTYITITVSSITDWGANKPANTGTEITDWQED